VEISNRAPNLDGMVHFSVTMPHRMRTNSWQSVWEYSILLCAITHVLYDENYGSKFISAEKRTEYKDEIEYEYGNCLLGLRNATSVYEIVNIIVRYFKTYQEYADFLYSPPNVNFRSICNRILRSSANICIYLDSLDDEMRRAPSIMTDITRALFYTVIKGARDTGPNATLHTLITMRDVVFSTIMSSDHSDRFLDTNYVLFLFWNPKKSRTFLNKKIVQTQQSLKISEPSRWTKAVDDLPSLLGFSEVRNEAKETNENVTDYFLRHTNFVPRNTVRFGNRAYGEIEQNGGIDEPRFMQIVSDISKEIADALLTAASAYLVASNYDDDISYLVDLEEDFREYLSKGAVSGRMVDDVIEALQSNLTDGFKEPLKKFVKFIGKDVFPRSDLQAAIDEFTAQHKDYNSMVQNFNLNRLENILWIQGLIGIRSNGSTGDKFYYFSDTHEQTVLPMDADEYVFFPGLNEVCKLDITKGRPVGPRIK